MISNNPGLTIMATYSFFNAANPGLVLIWFRKISPIGVGGKRGGGGLGNAIVNNFLGTFLRKSVRDALITHKLKRY